MWITQTYLSSPEPNAPLHIYYLFEDYKESHIKATEAIQEELERISATFPQVCILMPTKTSADKIEGELKANQAIWEKLQSNIPGVVISRKPIEQLDRTSDELFFVKLNYQGFSEAALYLQSKRFAADISKLRAIVGEDLSWQHRELSRFEAAPEGMGKKFLDAIEIKPGIAGFKIDVKKLFNL